MLHHSEWHPHASSSVQFPSSLEDSLLLSLTQIQRLSVVQAIILRLCFLLLCSRVEQLGSSEAEADSLCRPDGVEELSHIDLARTPPDTTRDDQAQHVRHPERVSQHGVVVGTFRANPSPALRVDADRDSILTMKAR